MDFCKITSIIQSGTLALNELIHLSFYTHFYIEPKRQY